MLYIFLPDAKSKVLPHSNTSLKCCHTATLFQLSLRYPRSVPRSVPYVCMECPECPVLVSRVSHSSSCSVPSVPYECPKCPIRQNTRQGSLSLLQFHTNLKLKYTILSFKSTNLCARIFAPCGAILLFCCIVCFLLL